MKIPFLYELEVFVRKNMKAKTAFLWKNKRAREAKKALMEHEIRRLALTDENTRSFDFLGLMESYNLLADDFSKQTFVTILKYRLAYADGILPPAFIGRRKELEELFNNGKYPDSITYEDSAVVWGSVGLFDLQFLNRNIVLYETIYALFNDLYLKQYEYHQNGVSITVQPGDYIIDGGGYFGDTALFFADDVGEAGRIFSFECAPYNLQQFNINMDLNPDLKKRVQLINRALWNNSKDILYFTERGGATSCSVEASPESIQTQTITIDDFMVENNIPKLDFLKLDIEGAELECLQGAANTIQKFQPNLAICVYHKNEDFVTIPQYIKSLVPKYKLYLKHHTDHENETVLYATKND